MPYCRRCRLTFGKWEGGSPGVHLPWMNREPYLDKIPQTGAERVIGIFLIVTIGGLFALGMWRLVFGDQQDRNALSAIADVAVTSLPKEVSVVSSESRADNTGISKESLSRRHHLVGKYCTIVGVALGALGIAIVSLSVGPAKTALDNSAINAAYFGMVVFVTGAVLCLVAAALRYIGYW